MSTKNVFRYEICMPVRISHKVISTLPKYTEIPSDCPIFCYRKSQDSWLIKYHPVIGVNDTVFPVCEPFDKTLRILELENELKALRNPTIDTINDLKIKLKEYASQLSHNNKVYTILWDIYEKNTDSLNGVQNIDEAFRELIQHIKDERADIRHRYDMQNKQVVEAYEIYNKFIGGSSCVSLSVIDSLIKRIQEMDANMKKQRESINGFETLLRASEAKGLELQSESVKIDQKTTLSGSLRPN